MITENAIREKIYDLTEKSVELKRQQEEIIRHLDALNTTLRLFDSESEPEPAKKPHDTNVTVDELRGKSLPEAVRAFAERHDGVIASHRARPMLIEAGVVSAAQSSRLLYEYLSRAVEFETVRRGVYRLRPAPDESAEKTKLSRVKLDPNLFDGSNIVTMQS